MSTWDFLQIIKERSYCRRIGIDSEIHGRFDHSRVNVNQSYVYAIQMFTIINAINLNERLRRRGGVRAAKSL